MITKDTVCKEICGAKNWEMTPENILTFAALLYIRDRLPAACELTDADAEAWVNNMENADGTTGASFSRAETDPLRGDCGATDFWTAMNMMKSDYRNVAAAFGVDSPKFYAAMARAFLEDKDAAPGKLCLYHRYIGGAK